MKRTFVIHSFINFVLGVAAGNFLRQAIQNSSMSYGVFAIMLIIAFVLNIVCGPDKSNNKW